MKTDSITFFEELSLNAWPALQTVLYDGWVLRFAGGYTRRANSVNPLYASSLSLDAKIAACEQFYRSQDLPVIFKLTPDSQPANLDAELAQRGYRADAHTAVQVMDLETANFPALALDFACEPVLTDAWFLAFCALSATAEKYLTPMRQILERILSSCSYGLLLAEGKPVACGLSVQQDGYLGFYDIVVAQDQRRKGYGRQIMAGLLANSQRNGARTAYLQVMLNNPPALRLYEGLGFRELYRYWYRVG